MIRVLLAGWSEGDWRSYRQEQWMAEVRRDPGASGLPRVYFDIPEGDYRAVVRRWRAEGRAFDRAAAIDAMKQAGGVEVLPR
jgi:hypothetical protein